MIPTWNYLAVVFETKEELINIRYWIRGFLRYVFTYCHYLLLLSEKLTAMNLWKSNLLSQTFNNIIGRGRANYCDLSVASRWIICQSRRLRQIIYLPDNDKSRYFAITEFNNIVLSCDHQVCFLRTTIFGKWSDLPLSRKSNHKKEKSVVSFTHEQNIICSETISWMTLSMSRPLFVGSYLQVTWWAVGQW